ncbi:Forkhead-associated (FHA) domain [Dillenia turbinata]|uniref:protein-serine/threonine phosphatase n=1 Tax=Dillenia turbinata TaxID=194707 RepID=A0AAN8UEB6_9MAGN
MVESIVVGCIIFLMLLIVILFVFIACKPWRFFSSSLFFSSRTRTIKAADDLERPLVNEDSIIVSGPSNDLARTYSPEGSCPQTVGHFTSTRMHGLACKQRSPYGDSYTQGDSLALDVASYDALEETFMGQTLKRPLASNYSVEDCIHAGNEDIHYNLNFSLKNAALQDLSTTIISDQRSTLTLEVVSGPSRGLRSFIQSTSTSKLPLTLGRAPPSDLLLKDSEVSGKHAMINWNLNVLDTGFLFTKPEKLKWELVDMGSLNGTLLNSKAAHHPDSGSRNWGDPVELADGDIITLGTTSKICVRIASPTASQRPFGVGIASDPMALRRGAKKLPMEDVCYYQWPLQGVDQFGLFGICDGHGGAGAAQSASKILPEMVASILSDSLKRESVLSHCDASDVLRDAFSQTEACMNHHYEMVSQFGLVCSFLSMSSPKRIKITGTATFVRKGCTATVLLVWVDADENFFAQCANVGDSACVVNIDGRQIKMTEDHRVSSYSERLRIKETGEPLKDGETRLCGLNLARMLGDKFLKQQDSRFSAEPYISDAVQIHKASKSFALLASDGFWDVVGVKKAMQLVLQTRERYATDKENPAEKIANYLLSEARTLRTKDNTSIIFLDFDIDSRAS